MLRRLRGRVNATIHRTAFVVVRGDQGEGRDSHKGGEEKRDDEVRYAEKGTYLGVGGVVIVVWVVLRCVLGERFIRLIVGVDRFQQHSFPPQDDSSNTDNKR